MLPDSVTQTIRVEDTFALATAKIRWQAVQGPGPALLAEPAVLTHVTYPARSLDLAAGPAGSKYSQQLVARDDGAFDIEVQYQTPVTTRRPAAVSRSPCPTA